ncbi:MAG TPA: penicillin-binding protein activator [Paucimonas sp.]|nr:penicillin-binding protein activator [Paucimonas sp.]
MSGRLTTAWMLAIALCGLCPALCPPVYANTTGGGAPALRVAQNDLALPPAPASNAAVPEPVPARPMPQESTRSAAASPLVRIALLLPLRSPTLGAAAQAVRAGFAAAHERETQGVAVNVIETDGSPQDTVERYLEASAGNDIVVGPLARSELTAVAQAGAVRKPTIALAQPEPAANGETTLPRNLLAIGLSIEDEARQVARTIAADKMAQKALVVSTGVAWQRRAAKAFAAQWRTLGLDVQNFELAVAEGFPTPESLLQLKKKIQDDAPQALFVALDANLAAQVRLAIGGELPVYGTSQLNPLGLADWSLASGMPDLNGTHLLDIPWQLQADHPAVMTYPRPVVASDQRRSADLERLYALGIDAYRIARELSANNRRFELDGVTGKLFISFLDGAGRFERQAQAAVYQDGKVTPLAQP